MCSRETKRMEVVDREERISHLPDELLVKILSSLETKHAFSTSVLSKRWTNLWALVPSVSLDHDPDTCISCLNSSESRCIKFENFVDQVILVYGLPHIQQFNIAYPDGLLKDNVSKVSTWLSNLFNRTIRELSMDFTGNPWKTPLNLSVGVFESDQLVSLTLMLEKIVLNLPDIVRFPKLKTCVISITNPSVNFTKKLCLGCPVLEELKLFIQMENCSDVRNFDICSLTLQKLELRIRKMFCTDHNIVLDTPVLEHLVISDNSLANYNMKNLESLAEAHIHVHDCWEDFYDHIHGERLRELLRGISKVRFLRLALLSLVELIRVDDDGNCSLGATTFMNVTSLELGVYCIPRMLIVLARMPNLVHLKLSSFLGQPVYGIPVIQWHAAPSYLPPHLKVIEVALEAFGEKDLQLLMYLLENAMLLEKMIIKICIPASTDEDIAYKEIIKRQERLLMCPCASETCEIKFVW